MPDFATLTRRALNDGGYSMRAAARAIDYDIAYLSRVLNGKQPPSPQLAEALDRLLNADGALVDAARSGAPRPPAPPIGPARTGGGRPADVDREIGHLRASTAHFAAHDARFGGDEIAEAALQTLRGGQRRLARGPVPECARHEYLSALAEAAELAGWLLFDAGREDDARRVTLEAMGHARQARDESLELSALSILTVRDMELRLLNEGIRLAGEFIARPLAPARMAAIARGLRGWALRRGADRARSRTGLTAAPDRSVDAAFPAAMPESRGVLGFRIALLAAHARSGAWADCEAALLAILPLLGLVRSAHHGDRLRHACDGLAHDGSAPGWLTELARDVAGLTRSGGPGWSRQPPERPESAGRLAVSR